MVQREIKGEHTEDKINAVYVQASPTYISADYNILCEKIKKNNSLSSIKAYVAEHGLGQGFKVDPALTRAVASYRRPLPLLDDLHVQILSNVRARKNSQWKGRYKLLSFLIDNGFNFAPSPNQKNLIGHALNNLSPWGCDTEFFLKFIQKSKTQGTRFEDIGSNTPVTSLCLLMKRYYKMLTDTHPGQLFKPTSPEKAQDKLKKHFGKIVAYVDSISEKNLKIVAYYSDDLYGNVSDKLVGDSGEELVSELVTPQQVSSGQGDFTKVQN